MPNPILKALADNPSLMEAVKKVVLEKFTLDAIDESLSTAELGQALRARLVGVKKVEEAFKDIAALKTPTHQTDRPNPGR